MIKKILLVEYAAPSIDAIKEALSAPIFDITVADEGEAAKKILQEQIFDLVITAAMLPKFHGFNLSLHVAENYPGTKIILISGIYKGADTRIKAINQFKADEFIEKPIHGDSFKKKVLELLNISEKDMQKELAMSTGKNPLVDTTKIPIIKKPEEDKKKDLTSEDIFGELIDKVEREPRYEISLGEDPPDKTEAEEAKTVPAGEKAPGREDVKTVKQEDKPDKPVQTDVPQTIKTAAVNPDTEEFTRPRKKPDSLATQKFEIDIESLVKSGKKTKDEKKFKKIEDEISKKFEDTLSGLGISTRKAAAGSATQKIDIAHRPAAKEQKEKSQAGPEEQFKTVRIENPLEMIKKEEEVGDYEILGLIARGGMAEIYKAKKKGVKGFEKIIALKKILSGYGEDDKYIEMFVDEAKIAAELSHPNIVQIYDLGQKDDFYFIAMEYVLGKDLRLILRRLSELDKPFPEELALHLILKVLSALNYAHAAKDSKGKRLEIVHRDISPPNILVSFDGNIKLTDFGVSKATTKMHQTVSGALKGKLLYMSPEQASSDSNIDYRSDLYSAGIILFELITGKKLFIDSSDLLVLKKVQQGEITKPGKIKKDIDPELERIILKALSKDKEKRYGSASDMMKDIETYLMNRYDRLPGPVHVSHFIYHIFKDDIIKEKIDFDLKPLPYEIKKTVRTEVAADSALEDAVEISEPLVEEEAPIEEMLTNSEGQFEPIIEIDLDREKEEGPEPAAEPAPAAEPEPAAKKQPGYLGIEGLEPPEEDNTKKYLMWIIILIAIGIVAAIFIINYLSSAEDDPRAGLNMPVKQTAAPVQDKEKEATGPDGAAAVGSQEEGESESSETTGKKANVQAEQPAQKEYVRPTPPPREKEKESSRLARTDRKPKTDESPKPVIPVEEATREKQEEKKDSPAKVESSSEEKTGIVSEPEKQPAAVQPTAAAVVAGQIFPSTELDTQPVPISEPLPKLTPILRRTLSGNQTIIVSFLVDHKGSVEKVRIVNKAKNKKLNALIIDTIKTWTYRPAIKDNVRVKVWQTKTLRINK